MVFWLIVSQLYSIVEALSPVTAKLVEKVVDAGVDDFVVATLSLTGIVSVEDELDKIRRMAGRIHELVKDAETRIVTDDSVRHWLAELWDLALDAEDLIDEFQTELDIQRAALNGSRKRKRSRYSLKDSIWLQKWRILRKIREIKERGDEIAQDRGRLQLREEDGQRREQEESFPHLAPSLEGNPLILGMNEKKYQILGLLSHPPVIAIVGARGIGKTELARLVFDDREVEDSSFIKIWIDVNLGEKRIIQAIIESISHTGSDLSSLDLPELQLQLKQVVARRKFFLVLDGVCCEEQSFWETLRDPLMAGAVGSRVLVTARTVSVLKPMHIFSTIRLNAPGEMEKKDEILGLLRQGYEWTIPPVIAILGAGGIGKTTLARLVFDDVELKSFQRIWISLSRDYSVKSITKKIIEAINERSCDELSLDLLQRQLQQLVAGKKFLLVLDGMFSENPQHSFWETLRAPLMVGSAGSRILVTARSELVLQYVQTLPKIRLHGLDDMSSEMLFMNHAFQRGGWDQNPDLAEIGKAILRKCQGSPLAIILIGNMLRAITDDEQWTVILNNMQESEDEAKKMLLTLKVSYDYLPLHLKRCFRFCSIFPNGYEFEREELVKLWIALGLINRPRGTIPLKYLAGRYFDYLLRRSFFQTSVDHQNPKQKCKMPGLIHELAQLVSADECLRIENDKIPAAEAAADELKKNPRYASLCDCTMESPSLQKICQHEKLRAFVLFGGSFIWTKDVLHDLFANLSFLRALDLRNSQLSEVPDSIGNLVHLRYLNLHGTAIEKLPETLSNLYNLQVLELGNCEKLTELPKDMSNLVNLRDIDLHLDWETYSDSNDLITMPAGIDRLTSLQTLSRFVMSSQTKCNLTELKKLDLRGEICISKLENVVDADALKEAELENKRYLEKLMLRWSYCAMNPTSQGRSWEKVIEHLRPHHNLKYLWIERYPGTSFPNWLEVQSLRLQTLILSNCGTCKGLLSADSQIASLTKLEIRKCTRLSILPRLPSLQELVVDECPGAIFSSICQLTSLSSLTVSHFSKLRRMPSDIQCLRSLRKLKIEGCGFQLLALQTLVSLESLIISMCSELCCFADGLPTMLQNLQLIECNNLQSLPSVLHSLSFLHTMKIQAVPRLTSLPTEGMPPALQQLTISGCPDLQQRCQIGGLDWHMIRDVPCVTLD